MQPDFAEKHITLVAILHIVYHSLGLLVGFALFGLLSTIGCITGDPVAVRILTALGGFFAVFLTVVSVPGIVGGVWLLRRREWARILTIIMGALSLLDIPLGTALGIYTFWALMKDEVVVACRESQI